MKKRRILITNDDGVDAPGILHLWHLLKDLGELVIVAPHQERSGSGVAITFTEPLDIERVERWPVGANVWQVNGTPADCVKLGTHLLFDRPPDLVVSGINRGSNAGRSVFYSGTVGAVIEAAIQGIPGVAFSCESLQAPNYARTSVYIPSIIDYLLCDPWPAGTLLNVNFPCDAPSVAGVRLAKQGMGYWGERVESHIDKVTGRTRYNMPPVRREFEEEPYSDIALLKEGFVTVVPIDVRTLTDEREWHLRQERFHSHIHPESVCGFAR